MQGMREKTFVSCFLCLALITTFSVTSAAAANGPNAKVGTCAIGYYGYNCRHHCHCRDPDHCDVTAYCHGNCADGWSGPSCQSQNLAFGMLSKIRSNNPDLSSRSAFDGNSSTCVTSAPDNPGWLRVDLQTNTDVYYITLIVAEGTPPRGWQVFVTEYSEFYTPCATVRSYQSHVQMSCDSPVTGRYVTVFNPHGPITVCELQVYECADYSFGALCNKTCQCADPGEVCHHMSGQCRASCRPGFTGRDCQQRCNMTYGSNCVTPCGHCRQGVSCNPVSGACPADCQPGWTGGKCDQRCESGRYGQNCAKRCGGCQDNAMCATVTGFCPGECESGLTGPRCDQGRHGPSCGFVCGQCFPGTTCNPVSGLCPKGCVSGWEGVFCNQECLSHHYGVNCQHECPHCLTSCNSKTGLCDVNGCKVGKRGKKCEHNCQGGHYGAGCKNRCGHCETGWCDIISGHCAHLWCQRGWDGAGCDRPCPPRMYGVNCSDACGNCDAGDICDPITGVCPGKCAERYYGDKCTTLAIYVDTTSQVSITLIASVLASFFFVVFVVCVCLCMKWKRDAGIVLV
ncbi:multiple epidermal growth factor-like domains protein 6 isoform X2 [Littorina saxatilis]|uniref:multiple epidermal growth factor-like domains protein 6 isoform X2 n=1 Tax=Littorina saxatilis TaxID=31220 RepID=UPI0038B5C243